MSERVKDEQHTARIVPVVGSSGQVLRTDLDGVEIRIDPAHSFPHTPNPHSPEVHEVEWQKLDHFEFPTGADGSLHRTSAAARHPTSDESLINALRLQGQYQAQFEGLDQQEKTFRLRLAALDDEQKRFEHRRLNEQAQFDARHDLLQRKETSFNERMMAFELQSRKFDAERDAFNRVRSEIVELRGELERQRADIAERKESLRDELQSELQSERKAIGSMKESLQKDINQAVSLKDTVGQRMSAMAAQNEQILKEERIKLWQSMTGDWEQRKTEFEREKTEWIKARQLEQQDFERERENWLKIRAREKSDVERERAIFESAIESANAEFVRARESLQEELDHLRSVHEEELARQKRDWQETRQREHADLTRRAEALRAEVREESESAAAQVKLHREQHLTEIEMERSRWQEERQQLATERAEFTESQKAQNLEIEQAREALTFAQQQLDVIRGQVEVAQQESEITIAAQKAEWDKIRGYEITEIESLRVEALAACESMLDESRNAIEIDRTKMREQYSAELQAEQLAWNEVRQRQEYEIAVAREQLEMARNELESLIAMQKAEWDKIRGYEIADIEKQRAEMLAARETMLAEARDAIDIELASIREQHSAEMESERTEWDKVREVEFAEIENQRAEVLATSERMFAESIATREFMLTESREALEIEFITLREQHAATLAAERSEWEVIRESESASIEQQRNEFVREKALIENRIRFQQDHLNKTRDELEQTQNDFRRERQLELQRIEEMAMLARNRSKQVELYRAAIDEREKSLDREQEVFSRTRKAVASTADYDRMNFLAEKNAWDQEQQLQKAELKRQQDALAVRIEGLDTRQSRLDRLRAELEETHRSTLEMRLAMEESWAQFIHATGQDEARQRVEQVRQALVAYYQQMHQTLADDRRDFADAQSKFQRDRADFAQERQELTLWLAERDEELRAEEERLRLLANAATANHTKWLTARDHWLLEKSEAERLIRRLLSSLSDSTREPMVERDAVFKLDELSRTYGMSRATGT